MTLRDKIAALSDGKAEDEWDRGWEMAIEEVLLTIDATPNPSAKPTPLASKPTEILR